jgi:hypothetical protein
MIDPEIGNDRWRPAQASQFTAWSSLPLSRAELLLSVERIEFQPCSASHFVVYTSEVGDLAVWSMVSARATCTCFECGFVEKAV